MKRAHALLLALLVTTGCATMTGEARRRASYELACTAGDVVVRKLPVQDGQHFDTAFEVEGCGRRARYVCCMHIELVCRRVPD